MRPLSLPSRPVDVSLEGLVEDGDVDVEEVGVMVVVVVVGVVEVVGVRLCEDVFTVTVVGAGDVFDGAVEIPYTITASAFRRVTVVVRAERDPSSLSTYPGSGKVTTTAPPSP